MAEEIALFIDFENIRYSLLNTQHREPDPQELINVARRYGTVMVAKAYADWSRQPEMFKGSLTAAMIDRVDCPAKQRDRYRSNYWTPGNGQPQPQQAHGWNAAADSQANGSNVSDEDEGDSQATREVSQIRLPEPTPDPVANSGSPAPQFNGANGGSTGTTQYGTQSTVDLNMLMDIIETVFDRPTISTFVLMTGDRDFTRICARLKLRLNKFVVVAGVPGTVSRDLTAAANQFVLLGNHSTYGPPLNQMIPGQMAPMSAGVEPSDPQFMQFLDYIDRHWAWRTVIGVSNFIGDPYNHKNRFRGRLTRDSARELLQTCIQQGILILQIDSEGNEDLRLNRANPTVESILASSAQSQPAASYGQGQWNQPQQSYGSSVVTSSAGVGSPFQRRTSIMSNLIDGVQVQQGDDLIAEEEIDDNDDLGDEDFDNDEDA